MPSTSPRRRGPRTAAGKKRVSTNAAQHGLTASRLLMPGEAKADYDAHVLATIDAMQPIDHVERHAVVSLADLLWREARCRRAEHQAALDALERAAAKTAEHARCVELKNARIAVNAIRQAAALGVGESGPAMIHLASAARGALAMLRDASVRTDSVDNIERAVRRLEAAEADASDALDAACVVALTNLAEDSAEAQRALDAWKSTRGPAATPGKDDVALLAKYRRAIDAAVIRQRTLIDELKSKRVLGDGDAESFRQALAPRPLRVVR